MVMWALAFIAITCAHDSKNPAVSISSNPRLQRFCEVANRIKGIYLGSLIREGMTLQQVEQVLGKRPFEFLPMFSTGSGTRCVLEYESLGISIRLFHGRNGDEFFRVYSVNCRSIFK
jgi:hypothetical protein